jgi:hypothetical protein
MLGIHLRRHAHCLVYFGATIVFDLLPENGVLGRGTKTLVDKPANEDYRSMAKLLG